MKLIATVVLGACLLGGCGGAAIATSPEPSASVDTTWDQQRGELWGGYWNRTARVCESPFPR